MERLKKLKGTSAASPPPDERPASVPAQKKMTFQPPGATKTPSATPAEKSSGESISGDSFFDDEDVDIPGLGGVSDDRKKEKEDSPKPKKPKKTERDERISYI